MILSTEFLDFELLYIKNIFLKPKFFSCFQLYYPILVRFCQSFKLPLHWKCWPSFSQHLWEGDLIPPFNSTWTYNLVDLIIIIIISQHYIGHYLEEKLSLDQMSIELYAGKGTIHNVALNTETLNDLLDQLNLPFEITEGFIGWVGDIASPPP